MRPRRVPIAASLLIGASALAVPGDAAPASRRDGERLAGLTADSSRIQRRAEASIQSVPTAESFSMRLFYLTEESHQTGTLRNMELAEYVKDRFVEYRLEAAHFHDTPALMSYGRFASVEILEPVRRKLKLTEDPHPEDKDSYTPQPMYREEVLPRIFEAIPGYERELVTGLERAPTMLEEATALLTRPAAPSSSNSQPVSEHEWL
ncbi:MAG: hypothetical protein V3S71_03530 [Acidobacteriota bacterium]